MPLLTMTTDWGLCDPAVGSFKGSLFCVKENIQVVDISHSIRHFDILTAAYVIKSTYKRFPKGTIHFIGMTGPEDSKSINPYLVVEADGHFFVGYDSGIFSLILDSLEIVSAFGLNTSGTTNRKQNEDLLIDTLVKLSNGVHPKEMEWAETEIRISYFTLPTIDANTIRGTIIYIDSFGNAIINITKEIFEKEHKGRSFNIDMRRSEYMISKISKSYEEAPYGEIVAIFNNHDHLEIALNKSQAAGLLGLKVMDTVRIDFL